MSGLNPVVVPRAENVPSDGLRWPGLGDAPPAAPAAGRASGSLEPGEVQPGQPSSAGPTDREPPAQPGASRQAITWARAAAQAAADKLGRDIVAWDVAQRLGLTDVFVVVTGANERHVGAIVEAVEERLAAAGAEPVRREGERDGDWLLLDFGDLVIHVFSPAGRALFALDRLWSDCPPVDLELSPAAETP